MRIGFRKILRDLWRSKGRTLLAVLSIAVGVFAVGMVSGMRDFVPARMMSSYRETSPAHVTDRAIAALNGTDLDGRTIKVNVAQERPRRDGGGGGGGNRGGGRGRW